MPKSKKRTKKRRMRRFTWHDGDIVFNSKKRKVTLKSATTSGDTSGIAGSTGGQARR